MCVHYTPLILLGYVCPLYTIVIIRLMCVLYTTFLLLGYVCPLYTIAIIRLMCVHYTTLLLLGLCPLHNIAIITILLFMLVNFCATLSTCTLSFDPFATKF